MRTSKPPFLHIAFFADGTIYQCSISSKFKKNVIRHCMVNKKSNIDSRVWFRPTVNYKIALHNFMCGNCSFANPERCSKCQYSNL